MKVAADINFVFFCIIAIIQGGCANVSVQRVTSGNQEGIRYWRPAPYLALESASSNGKSTCSVKLVMLPDKSQEFAITMDAGIGTVEASPTLQDGWNLTGFTGKADSKSAENITAIASLIKSAAPGGLLGGSASPSSGKVKDQAKCSGLIKILYDDASGQIIGFSRVKLPF